VLPVSSSPPSLSYTHHPTYHAPGPITLSKAKAGTPFIIFFLFLQMLAFLASPHLEFFDPPPSTRRSYCPATSPTSTATPISVRNRYSLRNLSSSPKHNTIAPYRCVQDVAICGSEPVAYALLRFLPLNGWDNANLERFLRLDEIDVSFANALSERLEQAQVKVGAIDRARREESNGV